MVKSDKYSYKIKTLSKLIISPRQQQALYKGIDFTESVLSDSINIVYPFYQRGEYLEFQDQACQYYIPGSSIKGVLEHTIQKNSDSNSLLIDDIILEQTDIEVGQINKIQNISLATKEKITLDVFFPNVAMEMCKANTMKLGDLFGSQNPMGYFQAEHQNTLKKLAQWSDRINKLKLEKECSEDVDKKLEEVLKAVKTIQETRRKNSYFMIIGGYKGLLLSQQLVNEQKRKVEDIESGIFIEPITNLPYGLVEISEVKKDE